MTKLGNDKREQAAFLSSLRSHGYTGRACEETDTPTHRLRAWRKRDPMFGKAQHYCGMRGRGFCDISTGLDDAEVSAVKTYMQELGVKE